MIWSSNCLGSALLLNSLNFLVLSIVVPKHNLGFQFFERNGRPITWFFIQFGGPYDGIHLIVNYVVRCYQYIFFVLVTSDGISKRLVGDFYCLSSRISNFSKEYVWAYMTTWSAGSYYLMKCIYEEHGQNRCKCIKWNKHNLSTVLICQWRCYLIN